MTPRTSQPLTEILRRCTVDVIDGINSGIYELYVDVICIAAGNEAASQIIRHRIPPCGPIPDGGKEIARIEQTILQCAVGRILDEFGGLQDTLKRSVALKKQARRQAGRGLIHRGCTWKTERLFVPMRVRRLLPALARENEMGGRFTKNPCGNSQGHHHLSSVFSLGSASLDGPVTPAQKFPSWPGATPISRA